MFILVDSREHAHKITGILSYFRAHDIDYDITKLYFGDYQRFDNPHLVIDRKMNIAELARNCTVEHQRFKRELERVAKTGSKLIVLVEQNSFGSTKVETIEDLILWEAPYGKIRGEQVYRVLNSWTARFPLEVQFCNRRSTGKRIAEILGEGNGSD